MALTMLNLDKWKGTLFYLILTDLKDEGLNADATQLEDAMKKRANHWRS
jgi:hypothetical protein